MEEMASRGEIGGRTVQIAASGIECATYPIAPLAEGQVRIRTHLSAISSGTEATFLGPKASNPYLRRRWNATLRVFDEGEPTHTFPFTFGYRAVGTIVESNSPHAPAGLRVWGNWKHTEYTTLPGDLAAAHILPEPLQWADGVDIAQMGPIALNAVDFAEGAHVGKPAVVFGGGPVGIMTAQIVHAQGGEPVYLVDLLPSRLRLAAQLGLEPVNAGGIDVADLKRKHGSEGIPVAWECSGSHVALNNAIRVVRRKGTVVAVGFYQGDAIGLRLGDEFHHNGVKLVSAQIGNPYVDNGREALAERILAMALAGELVLGGLPRTQMPVEEAAAGFAALVHSDEVFQVELNFG